ncbi:hypothetical protein A3D73_03950 [Candidatus Uhrbacteria bacterium RIFCSPHIGHO2_02_FULL_60_44]|nr:MAG: hypothetical protein A3D73_03950 [Candidatus Uhrbacteria bacterium RIFCSPHIGHO2_02_FULL_60_44]
MVLTLTGPSGTGKTSIAKRLLTELPHASLLRSYTTRDPRRTDLPGEYAYVTQDAFDGMQREGEFEWTASLTGTWYGTRREDLFIAIQHPMNAWISILVPERVPNILHVARELRSLNNVKAFFILPPSGSVLEDRMRERGDSRDAIEKRRTADSSWEDAARMSGLPYVFIEDLNGPIDLKVQAIKRHLL